MQIRCKSCGQLLYVPDSDEPQTVRCPACGAVFIGTRDQGLGTRDLEGTRDQGLGTRGENMLPQSPIPSPQSLSSYHFPRTVKITRLSTWEVFFSAYRLYAQHFWTSMIFALLIFLPLFGGYWAQYKLAPEVMELQAQLSQEQDKSVQDVWKAYSKLGEQVSPRTALTIVTISCVESLLTLIFVTGGLRLFNAYVRNLQPRWTLLLSGFDSLGRLLFTFILLILLQIGIGILSVFVAIPFLVAGLSTIGVLVLFSVFLFSIALMFFVIPLIADSNITVLNAFRISFMIARRNIGPLMGLEAMIFLMLFMFQAFASMVFGTWLSPVLVGMIGNALFSPLLVIILSVAYCKEIENGN